MLKKQIFRVKEQSQCISGKGNVCQSSIPTSIHSVVALVILD